MAAWGFAKYFYEQTHKDIDEVKQEVKELEEKLEEVDKRVDGHDVEISKRKTMNEAAQRVAAATGIERAHIDAIISHGSKKMPRSIRKFPRRRRKGGGGVVRDPFVEGAAPRTPREVMLFRCESDPMFAARYAEECYACLVGMTDEDCVVRGEMREAREVGEAAPLSPWEGGNAVTYGSAPSKAFMPRQLRRKRRQLRRKLRRLRRDPFPAGSDLSTQSDWLVRNQTVEADLRQLENLLRNGK